MKLSKMKLLSILLFASTVCFGQIGSTPLLRETNSPVDSLFISFISRTAVRVDSVNPILDATMPWVNTCPAGIITHPADATKFIFYRGEFSGDTSVDARITYFVGDNTDPFDLGTMQGVVLDVGGSGSIDENGARFGCVLEVAGTIYYYYVAIDASYTWRIALATSTDGINFTKQGVVLDVTGSELSVSDPMVNYSNGVVEMGYTVWSGAVDSRPNHNPGFSNQGMKIATSTDFVNFTRSGTTIIPLGPGGSIYDNNVEGGQMFKFNYTYATFFNGNDGSLWSIAVGFVPWPATNMPLNARFYVRPTAYISGCATCWDDGTIAVPFLHIFPNGTWALYYQAEEGATFINIGAVTLEP